MKQLAWLPTGQDGTKELHYRHSDLDLWQHYRNHPLKRPETCPDTIYGKKSYGFSTAQFLLSQGYSYVTV